MKIRLRFVGAGLWDAPDTDVFPYDDAPFPRVPVVGERVVLPDDPQVWRVVNVTFGFDQGLNYEPVTAVTLVEKDEG